MYVCMYEEEDQTFHDRRITKNCTVHGFNWLQLKMCGATRCLVTLSMLVYNILYFFQASVLVYYMAKYVHRLMALTIIIFLASPTYLVANRCFCTPEARTNAIRWMWLPWSLYILAYAASVILIFTKVTEKLNYSSFWGPNTLSTVLCITPVLLILLLTGIIPAGNQKLVQRITASVVLDLFDAIEMLEIILVQKYRFFDLPELLQRCILAFVVLAFLLSALALFQHKVKPLTDEVAIRRKTVIFRSALQVFFVNVAFLIIRALVWLEYGYDASVFITKNVLAIIISLSEIFAKFEWCGCGNRSYETFSV